MRELLKEVLNGFALKTTKKQIIFMSDDWGSVRLRSKQDQLALQQKGLVVNNRFDLYDSLETNDDLELLFEVLTKHTDHLGNHPVITAVTNVGNPDFNRIKESTWNEYAYETLEGTYGRYTGSDNVLGLFKEGINHNIFIPQSHGREHVQINWWMDELRDKNSYARQFFENEFFFLGSNFLKNPKRGRGIGAAFDVWDKKDILTHEKTVESALDGFKNLFGYSSRVFTPPAIFYPPEIESSMRAKGIEWIDVGRFLRIPKVGGGSGFQFNYLGRKKKSGLRVLVRNAVFEPNMLEHTDGVDSCLALIESAFKTKQPAIISNHRAAFAGRIDPTNRAKGLKALDRLFKEILRIWPDVEFVTMNEA